MKRLFVEKPLIIHPVLFVIFFILFFYTHNIGEASMAQILIPLGASLALALVMWVLLSFLLKDVAKAGLATSIFIFLFLTYGRFYELLEKWDVFIPKHGHLLPAVLLIFGYCVYFIKLTRRDFATTTKILNVVAAVLIVINLFTITTYEVRKLISTPQSPAMPENETSAALGSEKLKNMPDIYHIILDEYASLSTIKEYYGYDNSEFAGDLVDKGFFIAHESRTHIALTEWSLGSTLNMEYIGGEVSSDIALARIGHNKVAKFLRSKGYKFFYIGHMTSIADAVSYNCYKSGDSGALTNEFLRIAWNTTMLRPFYMYIAGIQFENRHRGGVIGSLELLKKFPEIQGPKFVFAHIMCPHEPFVFGPKGMHIGAENFLNFVDKQVYLGQYIFITEEIEKVIAVVLEKSKTPPIIILQSDHGPRTCGNDAGTRIFNALYLPGSYKKYLYDSISPVNTYRLIFNHYFGANFELLEE